LGCPWRRYGLQVKQANPPLLQHILGVVIPVEVLMPLAMLVNTYGYANAYGSAYTTTYGQSHTTSYNGAAAYAAQQQANANYNAYANSQYEIREKLSDGYVKLNTIRK
jgi:hypothetical protein